MVKPFQRLDNFFKFVLRHVNKKQDVSEGTAIIEIIMVEIFYELKLQRRKSFRYVYKVKDGFFIHRFIVERFHGYVFIKLRMLV